MSVSDLIKNKLYERAKKVMEKAYAPYSKFKVGAAIFDENGKYHVGCNIENSAYPIGNCAEASAISAMIASNGNKIIAISVTGYGNLLCTPCGGCRQRIREFATLFPSPMNVNTTSSKSTNSSLIVKKSAKA